MEENIKYVQARYPDAYAKHYASLSIYIETPMLKKRISGIFHTEKEAWQSAKEWIEKRSETASQKWDRLIKQN